MSISRRDALTGATAAVAVAAVPTVAALAADPEEEKVLALFRQMADRERAALHFWARFCAGLPEDPQLARRFQKGCKPVGEGRS